MHEVSEHQGFVFEGLAGRCILLRRVAPPVQLLDSHESVPNVRIGSLINNTEPSFAHLAEKMVALLEEDPLRPSCIVSMSMCSSIRRPSRRICVSIAKTRPCQRRTRGTANAHVSFAHQGDLLHSFFGGLTTLDNGCSTSMIIRLLQ